MCQYICEDVLVCCVSGAVLWAMWSGKSRDVPRKKEGDARRDPNKTLNLNFTTETLK